MTCLHDEIFIIKITQCIVLKYYSVYDLSSENKVGKGGVGLLLISLTKPLTFRDNTTLEVIMSRTSTEIQY